MQAGRRISHVPSRPPPHPPKATSDHLGAGTMREGASVSPHVLRGLCRARLAMLWPFLLSHPLCHLLKHSHTDTSAPLSRKVRDLIEHTQQSQQGR